MMAATEEVDEVYDELDAAEQGLTAAAGQASTPHPDHLPRPRDRDCASHHRATVAGRLCTWRPFARRLTTSPRGGVPCVRPLHAGQRIVLAFSTHLRRSTSTPRKTLPTVGATTRKAPKQFSGAYHKFAPCPPLLTALSMLRFAAAAEGGSDDELTLERSTRKSSRRRG